MNESYDSPKCNILLETGRKLFWKYGFKRVSIDEICREAEVSKMTFYRCFKNKTELAKTIYLQIISEGVEKFDAILEAETSATEKLRQILLLKLEGTNNVSHEFITDFYSSTDTGLKEFVEETTRTTWSGLISSFRKAQERGYFRKDFKPEFILYLSQNITPMMTDENLLKLYGSPQDLIMEFANFFTYGISPHE
ncbi:MAG: TetR/AcrR family transcriptional regulator [Bacteroidales bacterium]